MRIRFHARTHTGIKRSHNEDNFLILNRDTSRALTALDLPDGSTGARTYTSELASPTRGMLFAVADGVGGANAGEVASAMSVCCVRDHCLRVARLDGQPGEALLHAHGQVRYYAAQHNNSCHGMGTTLTVAAVVSDVATGETKFELAHVGDSRAYLVRDLRLMQLTCDQTLAQQLVAAGRLTTEEAARHSARHRLLQCVGQSFAPAPQLGTHELRTGDRVLLVTDGVTEHLSDGCLERILQSCGGSLSSATRRIIAECNERGGSDNITIVLAEVSGVGRSLRPCSRAHAALLRHALSAEEEAACASRRSAARKT